MKLCGGRTVAIYIYIYFFFAVASEIVGQNEFLCMPTWIVWASCTLIISWLLISIPYDDL